jgi:hypothetical protein
MNPGTDLLMAADWDSLLFEQISTDEPVPELTGLSEFVPEPSDQQTASEGEGQAKDMADEQGAGTSSAPVNEGKSVAATEASPGAENETEAERVAQSQQGLAEPAPQLRDSPVPPPVTDRSARRSAAGRTDETEAVGEPYSLLAWTLGIATGVVLLAVVIGTVVVLSRRP